MPDDILIVSGKEKRNRYLFISEPLKARSIPANIFIPDSSRLGMPAALWKCVRKNRNARAVIFVGVTFESFVLFVLFGWFTCAQRILRFGGNPFKGRKETAATLWQQGHRFRSLFVRLNLAMTAIMLRRADTTVAVSESLAAEFQALKYVQNTRVIPQYRESLPARGVTVTGNRRIVTVTNLHFSSKYHTTKRLLEHVNVFAAGHDKPVELHVIGGGTYLEALRADLALMNISENLNVELHGQVDDVDHYYRQADLFVYCSTFDALPNVLIEAQSYGLAILVNRAKFLTGVLEENVHALCFDLDNDQEFCAKLGSLLDDAKLRASMGETNKAHFESRYNASAVGSQWQSLLAEPG